MRDWDSDPIVGRLERDTLPWGCGAAVASFLLNGVWLACLVALESRGGAAQQARTEPFVFRLGVGSALLITVLQVPILVAMVALAARRGVGRAMIGGLLYAVYVPINLVAYFSYGRLAPMVHSPSLSGEAEALAVAGLVEIGRPLSLTGNLPMLGYALLGLAWCMLASALWSRGRLWKAASGLLVMSGALSVLGGTGAFVDLSWLTNCCLAGGVVSLPALAVTGVAMWREVAPSSRKSISSEAFDRKDGPT